MANAIFISEKWLKDNTPLPSNIDPKEIYPFYRLVQDKYLRDTLGDALYTRLVTGLIAADLNANEVSLLEMARPALAYYMVFEALPFLQTKIKNIGVVSTADDKQTNADRGALKDLRADVLNNAEYYMERVKRYLCTNSTLFPQFNFSNDDVNPNTKTAYTIDLYVDDEHAHRQRLDENWIRKYYSE